MRFKILLTLSMFFLLAISTKISGSCLAKFNVVIHASDTSCEFKNISSPNATFYYWNFGDGTYSIFKEKTDIVHKYKKPGKYKVTLTIEDTTTFNYCTEIFTQIVNFDTDLGTCNANYTTTASGVNLISFTNNSTGSYNKVLWNFGDGAYSNDLNNTSHQYTKAGKYKVKLIVYDTITGCKSIETKQVEVGNDDFYADFTYFSLDTIGSNFKFLNKSSNPSDNYWEFGDGTASRKVNPTHVYNIPGRYTVKLTVKHKNTGEITSYSEDIIVKASENKCFANFNSVVDFDNNRVYFLNESNASPKTRYTWNFGDENIDFKENTTHNYSQKGIYTVCLTLYDSIKACNSIYSDEVFVCDTNIKANKFDYFVDSANNVSFSSKSMNAQGVKWFLGDNINAADANVIHGYAENNLYIVHLQEYFNGFTYHQSQLINVNSEDTSLACAFGVIVNDEYIKAAPPIKYTGAIRSQPSRLVWNFGDGKSDSTTISPYHTYNESGFYNVCFTIFNQFENSQFSYCKTVFVDAGVNTSIKDIKNLEITISPNPVIHELKIKSNIEITENSELKIFNNMGLEVYSDKLFSIGNEYNIDVSYFKNGIYFIQLKDNQTTCFSKFIISK